MQHKEQKILTFKLDNIRFALYLANVERVIRAVSVTTVPETAPAIHGLMDYHGEHIPVVSIRKRFGRTEKEIEANDRFIITVWNKRKLAIVADEVEYLLDTSGKKIQSIDVSTTQFNKGSHEKLGLDVIKTFGTEKGIIIIYDLEKLLGADTIVAVEELFSNLKKESHNG